MSACADCKKSITTLPFLHCSECSDYDMHISCMLIHPLTHSHHLLLVIRSSNDLDSASRLKVTPLFRTTSVAATQSISTPSEIREWRPWWQDDNNQNQQQIQTTSNESAKQEDSPQ
jgi:hypothetical protein